MNSSYYNDWGFGDNKTLVYNNLMDEDEVKDAIDSAFTSKDKFMKGGTYDTETQKIKFEVGDDVVEVSVVEMLSNINNQLVTLNNEIYKLKNNVGDIGGNVVYEAPMEGKSLGVLMGNNGSVKLTEDITYNSNIAGSLSSKNKTTLKLNGKTLEFTGSRAERYGAFLTRGTQELTISGNGTLRNNEDGILLWCASANSIINVNGTTVTTFETNHPGAELIYCESGTINITGGIFKNNGSDYLLNCKDANYVAGTAKIIVTGGKFYDFDPGNNKAEGEGTSFLAEGYISVESTEIIDEVEHKVYTVKKA